MVFHATRITKPHLARAPMRPAKSNQDKENIPAAKSETAGESSDVQQAKPLVRVQSRTATALSSQHRQILTTHSSNRTVNSSDTGCTYARSGSTVSRNSVQQQHHPSAPKKDTSLLKPSNSRGVKGRTTEETQTAPSTRITTVGNRDSFGIDKLEIYDDATASSRLLQYECAKGSHPVRAVNTADTSTASLGPAKIKPVGAAVRNLVSRTVPNPTLIERQRLAATTTAQKSGSSQPTSVGARGPHTQVQEQLKDSKCLGSTAATLTLYDTGAIHKQKQRKRARVETDEGKDIPAAASAHNPQLKSDKRPKVEEAQPDQDLQTFDLSLEGEYSADIFAYLREMEILLAPSIGYLERRSDAFWINRQYYVNRLAGIHCRIQSNLETLFLAVNIFDRVLSKKKLQPRRTHNNAVVVLTCLLIASKFEERNIYANVCMFTRFTDLFDERHPDNDIDARAFRDCEQDLLLMLDYKLGWPGPLSFLRRCSRVDESEFVARTIAKFVLEVILNHHAFLVYKPSIQAAAAMYIGRFVLGRKTWSNTMTEYSGYTLQELEPAIMDVISFLKDPIVPTTVAYRKYSTKSYSRISAFVIDWAIDSSLSSVVQRTATLPSTSAATDSSSNSGSSGF
ncbi:G2/mitotic-specific cyclin [Mortierella alpina]|nr:G2/mitotic-specific cyclin [Mortierella alpina]